MKLNAYAKINLTLDVTGRRPDGYHELTTIMQSIELHDELYIEKTEGGLTLSCSDAALSGGDNLALRAAELFFAETGRSGGAELRLIKNIPVAAGLGGGSADAAAALRGLNALYGAGLDETALCRLGLRLGADVPFCIMGGARLCEGVGERMRPVTPLRGCTLLLVKPDFAVSTAEVYKKLDSLDFPHPATSEAEAALRAEAPEALAAAMGNALEAVTASEHPEIDEIKRALEARGALRALMSGSGPTVFGVFRAERTAEEAAAALAPLGRVILTAPREE